MRLIRPHVAAAFAVCLSGYPAIASPGPHLALAEREMQSALNAYAIARSMAEADIAVHPMEPLSTDDLSEAIAIGDDLAREHPADPMRLRDIARALWSVVAHIINATHPANSRT